MKKEIIDVQIEQKDELDVLIEEYNKLSYKTDELQANRAKENVDEVEKEIKKIDRKLLILQSKIEKLAQVYIIRYNARTLDITNGVIIFKHIEDAEGFIARHEDTLEVIGIFTNVHGKLTKLEIEVEETNDILDNPLMKKVIDKLCIISKEIKKDEVSMIYTLPNGCKMIIYTNDINPIMDIYDGHGNFYKKKEGQTSIWEYVEKIEVPEDNTKKR